MPTSSHHASRAPHSSLVYHQIWACAIASASQYKNGNRISLCDEMEYDLQRHRLMDSSVVHWMTDKISISSTLPKLREVAVALYLICQLANRTYTVKIWVPLPTTGK